MSYAIPSDVLSLFPRMVENQAGSVSDAQIQAWLDDATGVVHAAFFQRGLDTNNLSNPVVGHPELSTPLYDQVNILREFVRNYGTWKLASVLWAALSPSEQSLARDSYNRWVAAIKNISLGTYDKLFYSGARTVDILPQFQGVAGAEVFGGDLDSPPDGSTSRSFWSGQDF